ncbi:MAG: hypothetical protein M1817_006007 [Caeruleum heppii]|nr:MAG: hypothetical protein M1817_006007 [Caeruleum heppii]
MNSPTTSSKAQAYARQSYRHLSSHGSPRTSSFPFSLAPPPPAKHVHRSTESQQPLQTKHCSGTSTSDTSNAHPSSPDWLLAGFQRPGRPGFGEGASDPTTPPPAKHQPATPPPPSPDLNSNPTAVTPEGASTFRRDHRPTTAPATVTGQRYFTLTLPTNPSTPQSKSRTRAIPITSSDLPLRPRSPFFTPLSARAEEKTSYFPSFLIETSPNSAKSADTSHSAGSSSPRLPVSPSHLDHSLLFGPSSPLSPSTKVSMTPSSSQRSSERRNKKPMKLGNLPRFHPANFPSIDADPASTPQQQSQRQPSDAQRRLQMYQRELVASATRVVRAGASPRERPTSPRLNPLGSPGPVTPLALEEEAGYLMAGASAAQSRPLMDASNEREAAEGTIREEDKKRREGRGTPTGGCR